MEDFDQYPIPMPADELTPVRQKSQKGGMASNFSYNSLQTHSSYVDGKVSEVTESTRVKNGKGTKTVKIRKGRKVSSKTLPLTSTEIKNIQTRKFMPSLFAECHASAKPTQSYRFFHKGCQSQTRKVKRRTKKHSK